MTSWAAEVSAACSFCCKMAAYSLTTFCTYTAWMCPGSVVTLGRSMASSVCWGSCRCLGDGRVGEWPPQQLRVPGSCHPL